VHQHIEAVELVWTVQRESRDSTLNAEKNRLVVHHQVSDG
jgi:hypothetical protein